MFPPFAGSRHICPSQRELALDLTCAGFGLCTWQECESKGSKTLKIPRGGIFDSVLKYKFIKLCTGLSRWRFLRLGLKQGLRPSEHTQGAWQGERRFPRFARGLGQVLAHFTISPRTSAKEPKFLGTSEDLRDVGISRHSFVSGPFLRG